MASTPVVDSTLAAPSTPVVGSTLVAPPSVKLPAVNTCNWNPSNTVPWAPTVRNDSPIQETSPVPEYEPQRYEETDTEDRTYTERDEDSDRYDSDRTDSDDDSQFCEEDRRDERIPVTVKEGPARQGGIPWTGPVPVQMAKIAPKVEPTVTINGNGNMSVPWNCLPADVVVQINKALATVGTSLSGQHVQPTQQDHVQWAQPGPAQSSSNWIPLPQQTPIQWSQTGFVQPPFGAQVNPSPLYQPSVGTPVQAPRVQCPPRPIPRKSKFSESDTFIKYSHSKDCENKPGTFNEPMSEGTLLYPPASVHCRILTQVIQHFLYRRPSSILALNNECITDSLRNLDVFNDANWNCHTEIRSQDLCCESQSRDIQRLMVLLHSNPISTAKILQAADAYHIDSRTQRQCQRISKFVAEEYRKEGYEFYYFCFVNVKHPFHQAVISAIPLNSTTFEMCASKNSLSWSKMFNDKLKHVSGVHSLCGLIQQSNSWQGNSDYPYRGVGFSKKKLMNVIRETALKGVGVSALPKYKQDEKIRKRLNLSMLTGIAAHKDIIIPGIGVTVSDRKTLAKLRKEKRWDEYNELRDWGSVTSVSKSWLEYVYRTLVGTAWTLPRRVVSVQHPDVMKYVCETLLHVEYRHNFNWETYVFLNKDNPNYVARLPMLDSKDLSWILDTTGRYLPVLTSEKKYRVCRPYICDINSLRARVTRDGYLSRLKTEAILYLVSEFLQRGLTVKELHMDRESALGFLLRVTLYGSDICQSNIRFQEEIEERD